MGASYIMMCAVACNKLAKSVFASLRSDYTASLKKFATVCPLADPGFESLLTWSRAGVWVASQPAGWYVNIVLDKFWESIWIFKSNTNSVAVKCF